MKERNSNIELLRIFSMLMIVCGHFILQSGLEITSETNNSFALVFLRSGSRIATNIFLIIAVWFLLGSKFKAAKVLKIYGNVAFYTWILSIVAFVSFREFCSIPYFARGFVPYIGRAVWFASAYITLLLFAPLLNKVLEWNKKCLSVLVFLLVFSISLICTLSNAQVGYVLDSVWFLAVYLIVGYFKKYPISFKVHNIIKFLAGGASIYAL